MKHRWHPCGCDLHLICMTSRQNQPHVHHFHIHVVQACRHSFEHICHVRLPGTGMEVTFSCSHHNSSFPVVSRLIPGIECKGGSGAALVIVIISAHFYSRVHIYGHIVKISLRQLSWQHGELQGTGLFQLARFTCILSFQQTGLHLSFTVDAFLL